MKIFLQIIFQIAAFFGLYARASTENDLFEEKLAAVHSALSADIAELKGTIHINILPEIQQLKQKTCQCHVMTEINGEVKTTKDNSDIQDIEHRIAAMLKAFVNEKSERKKVSREVHELKTTLETKLRVISSLITDNEDSVNLIKVEDNKQNKELADIKYETTNIKGKTESLSEQINNVSSQIDQVCPKPGRGLKQPSFVSDWLVMKSQNESLCERTIEHNLGKYPAKVDVQIKPMSDIDNEMIFTGDAVFQSDDDTKIEYGGVVYFYNQTHVTLKAPKKNNDNDIGIVMTTGGHDTRFENINGDKYRFSEALVRVRVWSMDDFPDSAFSTNWLPLDVADESMSFQELSHGLSDYPGFVSVQIKSSTGMVSEGMGAVMTSPRAWSNVGGIIYAFDDKSVRIWSPFLSANAISAQANSYGRLLGTFDGWGSTGIPSDLKGSVKVTVWSAIAFKNGQDLYEYSGNLGDGSIAGNNHANIDINNDLVTLYVQALDGTNRGFLFKGYGASQSQNSPYGGAIYAYDKGGQVKVWQPKVGNDGYLVHINQPYGNGKHNQASNVAAYRVTLLKSVT